MILLPGLVGCVHATALALQSDTTAQQEFAVAGVGSTSHNHVSRQPCFRFNLDVKIYDISRAFAGRNSLRTGIQQGISQNPAGIALFDSGQRDQKSRCRRDVC
jgi:hypothetical protein